MNGRIRSRGIFIGYGVNTDGNREILGLAVGDTESKASWDTFFSKHKAVD
ncbi:hypothetical protein DX130_11750 [Paenibacillus paeoniae]|uniref:Transposase n=1 Tax=Paenibacillus paeoniae TaxID=2292705 RepID=A0A371PND3_9BACL|nr:transposase [Paenibacillus paeoniae]REK77633.1 hypothetical protein DX130_11750 [Paenibacillus paeoniae]